MYPIVSRIVSPIVWVRDIDIGINSTTIISPHLEMGGKGPLLLFVYSVVCAGVDPDLFLLLLLLLLFAALRPTRACQLPEGVQGL